ncbi:MAG: hypothetical protein NVS9B13_14540 [Candidatus Acidiferrum sp.]
MDPVQGEDMSDAYDWMQGNWYELGSLMVQLGLLVAGVWFAGKILRTLRASQEQVGALLKLSVLDTAGERPAQPRIVERAARMEETVLRLPDRVPDRAEVGTETVAARGGLLEWLRAPMTSGSTMHHGRVMRWLLAPSGS